MEKKNKIENLSIGEIIRTVLIAFIVYYTLFNFIVVNAVIPSGSMENTINIGDRIIADRIIYKFNGIKRGDVVIFHPTYDNRYGDYLIKRVIGLPGETIEGIDGYVYINGNKLDEPYVKDLLDEDFGPYTIPENNYFMMGDNRTNSYDSRLWDNKFISFDKIIGKALFKYFSDFEIFKTPEYDIQE